MWSSLSGNFHALNERELQVRFLLEREERKGLARFVTGKGGLLVRQSSARHEPEKEGLLCNWFHFCLQRSHLSLIEWGKGTGELDAFLNLLD
jgi:hypothetical protein